MLAFAFAFHLHLKKITWRGHDVFEARPAFGDAEGLAQFAFFISPLASSTPLADGRRRGRGRDSSAQERFVSSRDPTRVVRFVVYLTLINDKYVTRSNMQT